MDPLAHQAPQFDGRRPRPTGARSRWAWATLGALLALTVQALPGCGRPGGGRGGGGGDDDDSSQDDDDSGQDDDDSEDNVLAAAIIDSSDLVPAVVQSPYSAQLSVVGYDAPVTWAHTDGDLAPGLEFSSSGLVSGTPSWIGEWSFEVEVVAEAGGQLTDSLVLSTIGDGGTFVGFVHERTNNMTDQFGLMSGMWLRIEGGGEPGLDSYAPEVGLYTPGPNALAEAGWGDDVMVGGLELAKLDVAILDWTPTGPVDASPPGYPSNHYPEDSPLLLEMDNTLQAGADAGEATVRFAPDGWEPLEATVLVVPPDWCPNGVDASGGPGGPSDSRYCE